MEIPSPRENSEREHDVDTAAQSAILTSFKDYVHHIFGGIGFSVVQKRLSGE